MSGTASPWVAGVDGARTGWVVVLWDRRTGAIRARLVPAFAAVLALPEAPATIAVDMPIGLPGEARPGGRACEVAARGRLGARRASIFSPPTRRALEAFRAGGDYRAVAAAHRAGVAGAPGLSLQAFHLLPRIDDLDRALAAHRRSGKGGAQVIEAHPELSFAEAAGGRPMAHAKKSAAGRRARAQLLGRLGFPSPLGLLGPRRPAGVAADDLLDACAVCWTARRAAEGSAIALPARPERDAAGRSMAIWR